MNSLVLACPNCLKNFRIRPDDLYRDLACPHCGQAVQVPNAEPDPLEPELKGNFSVGHQQEGENKKEAAKPNKESAVSKPQSPLSQLPKTPIANSIAKQVNTKNREKDAYQTDRQRSPLNNQKEKFTDTFSAANPSERPKGQREEQQEKFSPSDLPLPPRFQVIEPWLQETKIDFEMLLKSNLEIDASRREIAVVDQSLREHRSHGTNDPPHDFPLPPKFDVVDPARFGYRRIGSTAEKVVLPKADGGFQTVSDKLVTIEYKGQVYHLIAMSPEEKKRRELIANLLAILIAVLAILITIYLLT